MLRPLLAALAFLLVAGCSDAGGTGPDVGPPASLVAVGPAERQAVAGEMVADSLVVRVTDARGRPVAGTTVGWATGAGGGSVSSASTQTDAAGRARVAWTLGRTAGENTVAATVQGLPEVRFVGIGTAGAAAQTSKVRGDAQTGTVGDPLSEPLVIRIADSNGNPVPGVAVSWTASVGGGAITPSSPSTNAAGEASAVWTLGTAAGEHTGTASVPGLPAQSFSATAAPGAPADLVRIAGDAQVGIVGTTLANPLSVRVTDAYGNPVGGASVSWEITAGGGRVSPASAATDPNGRVSAQWELGPTAGSQSVTARVAGSTLNVAFAATANPEHPGFASPVQLTLGGTVGEVRFSPGNTASGGQGAEIGGVRCIQGASDIAYHEHAHVSLFVNGKQIAIPAAIGVTQWKMDQSIGDGFVTEGSCFYGLHTHDATGIIHVEPPTQERLTLGQLFQLWGQPLSRTNVAGFTGPVTAYVDGELYNGDLAAIPFTQHGEITLQIATPLAPLPQYTFPPGY